MLQVLLAGLSTGVVLGLVAMGFSLVAGTVRVLHLAHGDVVVAAVFTGVVAVLGRSPVATDLGPASSVLLVALVVVAGVVLSSLVALLIVRPSGNAPTTWIAGALAVGLLLRTGLALLLPAQGYAIPDPLRLASLSGDGVLHLPGDSSVPVRVLGVLVIGLVVGLAAERLLVRSRFGRSLRAVADDPDAAALVGVNAGRTMVLAFAAAGALAALAGLLDAPSQTLTTDAGVLLGLEGVAAALLGGLGSLRGALVGGLAVGLLQSVAVRVAGAGLHDVAPLTLLVVLLALRPDGLRR